MRKMSEVFLKCIAMGLLLAGCAGLQPQVALTGKDSEKTVELKAESFSFRPNNIKAFSGDTVLFRIENNSASVHNFTVTNPQQQIIKSIALPARKTVEVSILFEGPGVYEFYCDRPLHSSFGMKGQVEVINR